MGFSFAWLNFWPLSTAQIVPFSELDQSQTHQSCHWYFDLCPSGCDSCRHWGVSAPFIVSFPRVFTSQSDRLWGILGDPNLWTCSFQWSPWRSYCRRQLTAWSMMFSLHLSSLPLSCFQMASFIGLDSSYNCLDQCVSQYWLAPCSSFGTASFTQVATTWTEFAGPGSTTHQISPRIHPSLVGKEAFVRRLFDWRGLRHHDDPYCTHPPR